MNLLQKIFSGIRSVRIQGATNVAKAGIDAYLIDPTEKNKSKILSLRPTEPLLENSLNMLDKGMTKKNILLHLDASQDKINKTIFNMIKKDDIIFTHCHSSTVTKALIYAKKKGKVFEVYNTETRPLFQGRLTAKELSRAGIKVRTFVDSGMHEAIEQCAFILIGADAITSKGVINKIGTEALGDISYVHKKGLYVAADSWKFTRKKVYIEERDSEEVWKNPPKNVVVMNPSFEMIPKKYVKGIISEFGNLGYRRFLAKARKFT